MGYERKEGGAGRESAGRQRRPREREDNIYMRERGREREVEMSWLYGNKKLGKEGNGLEMFRVGNGMRSPEKNHW